MHPQAMPVVLTEPNEMDAWMRAVGRGGGAAAATAGWGARGRGARRSANACDVPVRGWIATMPSPAKPRWPETFDRANIRTTAPQRERRP